MKRVLRALIEALLDRTGGSRRRNRHGDEDRYGWQGRNRDRHYREARYGRSSTYRKPKGFLAKLRKAM
jgi:hypothetical protein